MRVVTLNGASSDKYTIVAKSKMAVHAAAEVYRTKARLFTFRALRKMLAKGGVRMRDCVSGNAFWLAWVVGALGVLAFLKRSGLLYMITHKVDSTSTKHGGQLVADVLKAHGVKFIFTLTGGHISPILVACEKIGIRVVDTRHEVTAVFAADAVSRLSGSVGVAVVTAGPGVTNTVTALKNAQMAECPVLLIGGAAVTHLKGRGSLQDIDQIALLKSLCKFTASVKHVRDIVPTLRKALQVAQSDTPGPVFVEMPIDTLYPYHIVADGLGLKTASQANGVGQRILNWYLQHCLNNLFAGAWELTDMTPLSVHRPMASQSQVSHCAALLSESKKPVLVLGSQATLPPTPVDNVAAALKEMGVPCFLGGMTKGMLGRHSELHIMQKRKDALKEADLVILAGAVCDFRLSYGRVLSKKSKIVIINRNKQQIYKNSDLFWKPSLAIQGDVGSFLVSLANVTSTVNYDPEWLGTLRERDTQKYVADSELALQPTEVHINPLKVLQTVESVLPISSILVGDGGDFVSTAAYVLRPRGPLTWLDPGAFGTLGVGGGFALGAKLCRPDSEVWVIYGDGSVGYSVAEFDTFVRHKTPVIALVGNDACWTMIERAQVPIFNSKVACTLAFSDYQTVAVGYGGKGYKVDRSNEDSLADILSQARKDYAEGNSVLINCLIGKTSYRDGSLSV